MLLLLLLLSQNWNITAVVAVVVVAVVVVTVVEDVAAFVNLSSLQMRFTQKSILKNFVENGLKIFFDFLSGSFSAAHRTVSCCQSIN